MYLDTVYYGVAITHLGNNHIEYSAFHWSSVFFCVSVCVFVLITWLSVLSESSFLPSQLKEMPVRRTEASSIDHTVSTQRGLHLPHRQSRCHARCTRGPRGTCHRPRQGTRSRGSRSQTNCRSLEHGQNNMTYVKKKTHTFWASWLRHHSSALSAWWPCSSSLTSFTVRLSVLQVEGVVPDWLLTGSAEKAVDMPRLFEGVYHLL